MSANDQNDSFTEDNVDQWNHRNSSKVVDNSKKLQKIRDYGDSLVYEGIEKSTSLQQEDVKQQKQESNGQYRGDKNNKLLYSSQFDKSQNNKQQNKGYYYDKSQNNKQQNKEYYYDEGQNNTQELDKQQKQEYQSISSDKSQGQRQKEMNNFDINQKPIGNQNKKYDDIKEISLYPKINEDEDGKVQQGIKSEKYSINNNLKSVMNSDIKSVNNKNKTIIEDNSTTIVRNKNFINKTPSSESIIKSQTKFLQQSIPIHYGNQNQYQNTHATFSVNTHTKNTTHSHPNQITSIKEGFQPSESPTKKYPSNQVLISNSSSNSLSSNNQKNSNKNSKLSKTFQQIEQPSQIKTNTNIKASINSKQIKQQFLQLTQQQQQQHSSKDFKSQHHNNYALKMKKSTSYQSPKRQKYVQKSNKLTTSHDQKSQSVKYYGDNDNDGNFQSSSTRKDLRNKGNNEFQGQQQMKQAKMFYVSISGQQMYPSLDLKKEMNKNITGTDKKDFKNEKSQNASVSKKNITQGEKAIKQQKNYRKTSSLLDPSLPCQIKISQYRSQYFLKVQTQVFTIHVQYPPSNKVIQLQTIGKQNDQSSSFQTKQQQFHSRVYEIERRFSDFVFLYESIMTNHLGYIIYPFPQKSLQSFVKIKLQSLIGNAIISDPSSQYEAQKMQLIQRRIQQLQKFVNFLLQHEQLKYSQEVAIFLTPDIDLYHKSRQRIAKYIDQYKELQSSGNLLQQGKKNIKKVIQTGYGMVMKWWSSQSTNKSTQNILGTKATTNPKVNNTVSKSNAINVSPEKELQQEFTQYSSAIETIYTKYHMLQKSLNKLIQMYENTLVFKDIDTEFDYLMKLCVKVSSGKQYVKAMKKSIDEELLKQVEVTRRYLQQAKGQLTKREEIKTLIEQLKASLNYNNDLTSKISKLQRRMDRFDKNFRFGFNTLILQCEQKFQTAKIKFANEWQGHCKNMRKIWK